MKHLFLTIFALVFAATDIQAQRIKGSDTVLPIAQQTAERFMTLNPNARVTVTGGGSGVGSWMKRPTSQWLPEASNSARR